MLESELTLVQACIDELTDLLEAQRESLVELRKLMVEADRIING